MPSGWAQIVHSCAIRSIIWRISLLMIYARKQCDHHILSVFVLCCLNNRNSSFRADDQGIRLMPCGCNDLADDLDDVTLFPVAIPR